MSDDTGDENTPPPPPDASEPPPPPPGGPPPAGGSSSGNGGGGSWFGRTWQRFRSWPTWAQVATAVVLLVFVVSAIASPSDDEDGGSQDADEAATETEADEPSGGEASTTSAAPTTTQAPTTTTTEPPPAPQQFEGSGNQAVGPFPLEGAIAVFTFSHQGSANFIIEILDANGETVDFAANEIGSIEQASSASGLRAGEYLMEITASGAWTVTIEQPQPSTGESLPVTRTGTGNVVVGPLDGDGAARVAYSHQGSANFIIEVLDRFGQTVDFAANEIGAVEGSSIVNLAGINYLEITADGAWEIMLE